MPAADRNTLGGDLAYVLNLHLADPGAAQAFVDAYGERLPMRTWQEIRADATELAGERKFDESVHELREFIRPFPERPNRIPAHLLLGRVLEAQGRWQEATVEFEAILARDATNAVARGALIEIGTVRNSNGAALASGGNLNAAIAEFQEAVRLNPGDQKAQSNLARALALRPR